MNKTESLSEGVWESEHRRIRLTRVEGKWQSFGYEDSTGKYVECYEGLFLMEMVSDLHRGRHKLFTLSLTASLPSDFRID